MSSNVVVIKVKRTRVGTTVAFDKLYFFKKEEEHLIPSIFQYALVFPVTTNLLDDIASIEPYQFSHYKTHRDDATLNTKISLSRNSSVDWWKANIFDKFDFTNRLVVIPVLTSTLKDKLHPKYLSSPRWYTRRSSGRRRRYLPITQNPKGTPISEFAYISTPLPAPNDKISPICSICPRQLLQLQGECSPGQTVCLQTLNFSTITEVKSVDDAPYLDEENPFDPSDYQENG